ACRQPFRLRWFPCLLREFNRNMPVCKTQQYYSPLGRGRNCVEPSPTLIFTNLIQRYYMPAPQPLTSVSLGAVATVAQINVPAGSRARLMEMGLLVGTKVELVRFAPMGDP